MAKACKRPDFSAMTKSDQIISAVGDGVTVHDREFRIIYQNQTMKSIFGECVGKLCFEAYQHASAICPDCPVAACFGDGEVHTVERIVQLVDKKYIFETCASPIHDISGAIVASVEVVRNATRRNEEQVRIARLKNLYEAISRVNKAIILTKDKYVLFQEICRILVHHGTLSQAEIDITDSKGMTTQAACSSTKMAYHDTCRFGDTTQENSSEQDLTTDKPLQPVPSDWSIRSSALFPLTHEGKSFGVLKAGSEQHNFFDREVVDQLQEMTTSISFAIDSYSNEELRRQTEKALKNSEEQLRMVLEGSDDGYWNWNVTSGSVKLSPHFLVMLGLAPEKNISSISAMLKMVHPADKTRMHNALYGQLAHSGASGFDFEVRMAYKSKNYEWFFCRGKVVSWDEHGAPTLVSGIVRKITGQKLHEEELQYKCTHDQLTGLYNRAYFDAELARVAQGRNYPISIVVADVDGLKRINDQFGHAEGDHVIKQTAQVLQQAFRGDDVVARIGGDEFVAILQNTSADIVQEAIGRMLQLQAAANENNQTYTLSISLGSATAERSEQLAEALKLADSRMYDAKFQHDPSHETSLDLIELRGRQTLRKRSGKARMSELPKLRHCEAKTTLMH